MNKINRNKELKRIILSYLKDEISEKDRLVIEEWLAEDTKNSELLRSFENENNVSKNLDEYNYYDPTDDWDIVRKNIKPQKRLVYRNVLRYAAIFIVVLGSWGVVKYLMDDIASRTEVYERKLSEITPGESKAVLILPNGKEIKLEEIRDTSINTQEGKVLINRDNTISYESKSIVKGNIIPIAEINWHTIKIPRGGEYILSLSDGTKVWLNSETEIRYPSEFLGKTREVFLTGEAYFDVEKNPNKPFVVNTKRMDIKVLGTSFNVMAYPDEESSHTTLVEGLVEIRTEGKDAKVVKIHPGQQALLEKTRLKVKKVNTKSYTDWKDGRFAFNSESLESVVRKLSRWYDIEFFFINSALKERRFTGNIPKYQDISKVIEMLEFTSKAKFSLKNNSIIIREK